MTGRLAELARRFTDVIDHITDKPFTWGQGNGTLSDQTDLQTALDGKAGRGEDNFFTQRNTFVNLGIGTTYRRKLLVANLYLSQEKTALRLPAGSNRRFHLIISYENRANLVGFLGYYRKHVSLTWLNGSLSVFGVSSEARGNIIGQNLHIADPVVDGTDFIIEIQRPDNTPGNQGGALFVEVYASSADIEWFFDNVSIDTPTSFTDTVPLVDNSINGDLRAGGLVLTSPDETQWRVTIDNSGTLQTTSL